METFDQVWESSRINSWSWVYPIALPAHALSRIKPVDERFRLVFEFAEYYVPLVMTPITGDADVSGLTNTGHRWHTPDDA